MKTLLTAITISIGFVVASIGGTASVGIVDATISGSTNQSADVGSEMSTRTYTIAPDTFFRSLKQQIAPKDGESDIKLLRRYFQDHHIDFTKPKTALFLDDKLGKLFVRVTPADQDEVERLIVQIANTK